LARRFSAKKAVFLGQKALKTAQKRAKNSLF